MTWNGMFYKTKDSDFTDHFDVLNVKENNVNGVVEVTVEFDNSPGKQYVFEIDEDDFKADKQAIGDEILRQLRA